MLFQRTFCEISVVLCFFMVHPHKRTAAMRWQIGFYPIKRKIPRRRRGFLPVFN
jgi:hypothetical protein